MKCLVSMFIVLGLLAPVYAETELLYEDFEGPAPGTLLTSLGWTGSGTGTMVISDTLVDQGQSVGYTGTVDDWPSVSKAFSYAPGAGEQYVFTGTLWSAGTGGNYAHAQLRDSSSSAVVGKARLHVNVGYNGLTFGYILADGSYGDYLQVTPQALVPVDFKAVITGSSFDAYWRLNGESAWTYRGNSAIDGPYGGGIDMADFDTVDLTGHGGDLPAGIDTIRLAAVPEPTAIMLCVIGMATLFVLRRRS